MIFTHPEFLALWASSTLGQTFQEDEYFNFLQSLEDRDDLDVDEMSYEELLELCETIGDHKEGIKNIDDVSVVVEKDTLIEIEKCPVCLEEFKDIEVCRKINVCGHVYCSECIQKWFSESKRCPVCKKEAHQIASISKSSSPSPAPTSSGESSTVSPSMNTR